MSCAYDASYHARSSEIDLKILVKFVLGVGCELQITSIMATFNISNDEMAWGVQTHLHATEAVDALAASQIITNGTQSVCCQ